MRMFHSTHAYPRLPDPPYPRRKQGFDVAPEGLWRPVNATTNDSLGLVSVPRYGHTATVLNTGEANPTEVHTFKAPKYVLQRHASLPSVVLTQHTPPSEAHLTQDGLTSQCRLQ